MASYSWVRPRWHTHTATEGAADYRANIPATPHGGSSLASYGSALATITTYCSPLNPPRALLDTLRRDSKILLELTADFVAKASQLQIVSFYEMKMTRMGLMKKMVHKNIPIDQR